MAAASAFVALLGSATVLQAATIAVTSTADDVAPGPNGNCTLREAVIAANTNAKVDGAGTLVWQRSFDATHEGLGLAPLTSGGFAIGIAAGDGQEGALLIRTDPLGNEIWRQGLGDPAFQLWHMVENANHGFGWGGLLDSALHAVVTDEAGNVLAEESLDRGSLVHEGGVGFTATRDGGYALASSCATVGEADHDFCLAKTDAQGRSAPAPG